VIGEPSLLRARPVEVDNVRMFIRCLGDDPLRAKLASFVARGVFVRYKSVLGCEVSRLRDSFGTRFASRVSGGSRRGVCKFRKLSPRFYKSHQVRPDC
jgi:hypothetical protein